MIESFVQFAVKLVRANPLLKSTVGEFVRKANSYVLNIDNFEEFGSFEDSRGKSFTLRKGLRDYLKPDWRTLFDAEASTASLSRSALVARTRATTAAARNFEQLLTPFSDGFVGKTVLEIGCYDGASAFALSKSGCRKVVASDLAAYYIRQNPLPVEVQDQERHLGRLRSQVAEASKTPVDNVEFVFDDIISSSLPSNSFDIVCSWEVLEHVNEPDKAFREIARLLRPGGIAIHDYNPFFCLTGGHSPCTLDFLWGHARLSEQDFERYVREYRPAELPMVLNFFRFNLNRMTLAKLKELCTRAGLDELAILPVPQIEQSALVSKRILEDCRSLYDTVTVLDLISSTVFALHRKPDSV